ncbi:MAG TPA: S-layer homology domain-containing protein [Synechococcales cyanobacterium M55_K2018_004]|nr:S-layer homology domain-containing protein [Synechococcales cyanobacterium M55_K2018_004]
MVPSPTAATFFVHPLHGNDTGSGTQTAPFRTLSRALRRAAAGDVVRLAGGTYSAATGELFPLVIPAGVVVVGDEANQGKGTVVEGSGDFTSATFGRQSVAIALQNDSQLRGVTVINRTPRGTGVWLESTSPIISRCILTNCGREGVLATGTALPLVVDCLFQHNAASGISCFRNAKGEIRRSVFVKTGVGIALSDQTAPLLVDNRITECTTGIVVTGSARPVLRHNWVELSTTDGLVVLNSASPDLGRPQDPGGNILQNSGRSDLRNETGTLLVSVGNAINPVKVNVGGNSPGVDFVASEVNRQIQASTVVVVPPLPAPTPPAPVIPAPPGTTALPDLVGHWAEAFIRALVQRQMVSGFPDGTFKPEVGITRAQYAALLAKAFNRPETQAVPQFADVPAGFWAQGAIAKAVAMGFLAGFPDGSFRPNQNLTRIQTIVSLANGLGVTGGNPTVLSVYRDRAQIPSYATLPTASATQRRIVVNHPQVEWLKPMVDVTRAEVAVMVYQALVALGQAPAIASPFIVSPDGAVVGFSDIEGHWAASFIRGLASQDLISGFSDGTFQPHANINRAQYAALLAKTFAPPPQRPAIAFPDVPANFWGAAAIQQVYRGGLMSGFDDGTFRPHQNLRRVEVLLALANSLRLGAGDLALLERFADRATIPAFARSTVAAATANRLVVNHPQLDQLRPLADATRAEVAAMVYQALVRTGRSPALASPFIVDPMDTNSGGGNPPLPSRPLILLDPGHGGADPGAIGIGGLREVDVVLPIALEAAAFLKQRGYDAQLTRSDDRELSLAERVAIATQRRATHFISIHANAVGGNQPQINGLETFHHPDSVISRPLAQAIHTTLVQSLRMRDRGVKTANFFVLRNNPTIPAVLVEVGFVTGAEDAANLSQPAYRTRLARAIALGIEQFLRNAVG